MAHGHIFARFALKNGATRLVEHTQNAPLKIARAFASETHPGGLDVCVMDSSPGLLAGDCHSYEWVVETGARVRITTQGATRVHPAPCDSKDGDLAAIQKMVARVAKGATLELWPEAIIPFRNAIFCSRNEIHLEESAHFSIFECLSAGRIARDEIWQFARVSLQTRIFGSHGPCFCAQNRFAPSEWNLNGQFSFGPAKHWASLVAFGQNCEKELVQSANEFVNINGNQTGLYGAASSLPYQGFALSLLSNRAHDARHMALEIEHLLGVSRETPF